MKTFRTFLEEALTGVAPKAKGEHKFVHSTFLNQIKDPGDLEKVGPEEIGPHDTKAGSGKRPLDRLDNKQKFGESVDLEENYRALAQKGIGAERKQDIKVGHGVDYYHPKDGSKHMGKIHDMDDKGYTVKDDKTGEKHKFDYFRKEEVELEEAPYMGKGNHRPGWMLRADPELAKKVKDKIDAAKLRQKYMGKTADEIAKMKKEEVEPVEEGRGAYDELTRRMGTSSPGFNKTPAGKAREQKRRQEHLKGQMKFTQRMGGLTGPKSKLPEEVELEEGSSTSKKPFRDINSPEYKAAAEKQREKMAKDKAAEPGKKLLDKIEKKGMKEESELEEADFSKSQTKMAHAIGKHFKSKGIGDESKGGPFAVASAMVRDKPDAAKKAYATIKAKMKNEDHQDMLMALYDELSEENQSKFEEMLEVDPEKLLTFAQSHFFSTEE
jgi:hypothetical protein